MGEMGQPFDDLDDGMKGLLTAAIEVKSRAYCPYSNFHVGCAVLTESGDIFTGCNVENASYGLTVCAERVAVANAVTGGHRNFKAIAVSCDLKDSLKGPCGACRQVLIEFGVDWDFYIVRHDKRWKKYRVGDLIPDAFTPASLVQVRVT